VLIGRRCPVAVTYSEDRTLDPCCAVVEDTASCMQQVHKPKARACADCDLMSCHPAIKGVHGAQWRCDMRRVHTRRQAAGHWWRRGRRVTARVEPPHRRVHAPHPGPRLPPSRCVATLFTRCTTAGYNFGHNLVRSRSALAHLTRRTCSRSADVFLYVLRSCHLPGHQCRIDSRLRGRGRERAPVQC
jgi:hypothetical protein